MPHLEIEISNEGKASSTSAAVPAHLIFTLLPLSTWRDCPCVLSYLPRCFRPPRAKLLKPVWKSVSPEAKNLLGRLLTPCPRQRFTCEQALQHPWLKEASDKVTFFL